MSGNTSAHGSTRESGASPQHKLRHRGLEWLADLNPQEWRKPRTGAVNNHRIAQAAGLPSTTYWRQAVDGDPLSEPVMSALLALAMLQGADEDEARKALIAFQLPPKMARAAEKARLERQAANCTQVAA